MKELWYKDYMARGGCEDILSEFENVEEFQSTVPFWSSTEYKQDYAL